MDTYPPELLGVTFGEVYGNISYFDISGIDDGKGMRFSTDFKVFPDNTETSLLQSLGVQAN